jgi:hypothetical protein
VKKINVLLLIVSQLFVTAAIIMLSDYAPSAYHKGGISKSWHYGAIPLFLASFGKGFSTKHLSR